jgi:hypothetical protein
MSTSFQNNLRKNNYDYLYVRAPRPAHKGGRRRPNRTEPRAVKHRPKPYPLLNQPRHRFVEISHRSDYWKGRPRNYQRLN